MTDLNYAPTGQADYLKYQNNIETTKTFDANELYRLKSIETDTVSSTLFAPLATIGRTLTKGLSWFFLGEFAYAAQTHSLDLEETSSQYTSITDANQTDLNLSGDFTLEAWIQPEVISGDQFLISKDNFDASKQAYWIALDTNGKITGRVSDDGSNSSGHTVNFTTNSQVVFGGIWAHIAVTFDISANKATVYVNNKAVAVTNTGTMGTSIYDNDVDFVVGRRTRTTPTSYFDGKMKDVRVFSDIRTTAELG